MEGYRRYATTEGMDGTTSLPHNMDIPETRQLRWEREALVQSKYASGDEVFALRKGIMELQSKLSEIKDDKAINDLEKELHSLNERDAEFMYAISSELMEKAEMDGDVKAADKYRSQLEEARLCIPQLNMHGLWVGK